MAIHLTITKNSSKKGVRLARKYIGKCYVWPNGVVRRHPAKYQFFYQLYTKYYMKDEFQLVLNMLSRQQQQAIFRQTFELTHET